MSKIKSKDSRLEKAFRKALWNAGLRYRKNPRRLFGKPDIALQKHKVVIFLDSCFWHGCGRHCRIPSTKKNYWEKKINRNKFRDQEVTRHYRKMGWQIFRIWEHDLVRRQNKLINLILNYVRQTRSEATVCKISRK
ncbi:MAG: very short patch repair endonuclease [Deltaproteobacteria bacterium]|nr:very short patch repair endonuclease [Deltaproteobacteria bacterium]